MLADEDNTKTTQHRTVRLLAPLKLDLAEWLLASGSGVRLLLLHEGHSVISVALRAPLSPPESSRCRDFPKWSLPVSNR